MIFNYNGLKIDTKDLIEDDMPNEIFKEIFVICGVEVAVSILLNMQGNIIQVPTRGMQKLEKRIIVSEYDGTSASIRKIARTLAVSETYIRDVLRRYKKDIPSEGQMTFTFPK